ncbi:MAG: restriction endonuclease subunit S [Planctomycetes bacterium]|uniref:restriction endonuclease subunit S n=1 Tax=Candidatus Wunengus californicus TaxID=3367619 RepID=UPI00402A4DE5|nr:restriction endonuclease subunit S [Planctomycetota bacterium]
MTFDTSTWEEISFGEIARSLTIAVKNPLSENLVRYVGLEHIEPGNIHIKSWGNVADGTTFTRVFRKGQVLFGKRRAYQKKASVVEFDGVCSGDILVLEAIAERLSPGLLPFIVQSDRFFDCAVKTSAGSLSPRTKFKDLAKFTFKLPPMDEQKRIADLLWSIEEVIEKWSKVESIMKSLYERFGREVFLGKKLDREQLCNIAQINMGQSPPGSAYNEKGEGAPFLQGNAEFGEVFPRHLKYTKITTKIAKPGNILLSVRAPVGEINIADKEYCIGRGLSAISMNDEDLNKYLKHALIFLRTDMERVSTGSTFKAINKSVLESLEIPFREKPSMVSLSNKLEKMTIVKKGIQSNIQHIKSIQKQIINKIFG